LDETDSKIIGILTEDSRVSYRKIADTLGIAIGTVHNRIKRLEKDGILKAYTVMADPAKLGYELTAMILVQAEGAHLQEVEAQIAQSDSAICVYDVTGDFDIAVVARFKSRYMLNSFIKEVLKAPHITRTVTGVVLNVVKEDFRIKPSVEQQLPSSEERKNR
jgi:DNA-binding Lrp family transcriptional regulator